MRRRNSECGTILAYGMMPATFLGAACGTSISDDASFQNTATSFPRLQRRRSRLGCHGVFKHGMFEAAGLNVYERGARLAARRMAYADFASNLHAHLSRLECIRPFGGHIAVLTIL